MRNHKNTNNNPEVFKKPRALNTKFVTYAMLSEVVQVGEVKIKITRTEPNGAEICIEAPKEIKINKY